MTRLRRFMTIPGLRRSWRLRGWVLAGL